MGKISDELVKSIMTTGPTNAEQIAWNNERLAEVRGLVNAARTALKEDIRTLAEGGAFYRTKALKELREACADLARLDDTDIEARIERVDTWLDRYQCSRPDWEADDVGV